MSFVYVMKNMDNGYYKIGYSDQPQYRERTLQAQEPDVRLLATVAGTKELEQKLQRDFSGHRVRGEWFALFGVELLSLAAVFSVPIETIDPPSEKFTIGDYHVALIHRYAGQQTRTRVLEKDSKRCLFEVPYLLSESESELEIKSEYMVMWEIGINWQDNFLRTAFRNVLLEQHKTTSGSSVEIIELRCLATNETRGYYVDTRHSGGSRFYPERREAEVYFNRMKKCFDIYSRIAK